MKFTAPNALQCVPMFRNSQLNEYCLCSLMKLCWQRAIRVGERFKANSSFVIDQIKFSINQRPLTGSSTTSLLLHLAYSTTTRALNPNQFPQHRESLQNIYKLHFEKVNPQCLCWKMHIYWPKQILHLVPFQKIFPS